ncbi:hypothetical protein K1719_015985 [Acacia pycnantha]|nr:hypothetical protein K1719_015985 [Acacia pycnantha]
MAVITPYAQFLFKFVSDAPDKNVTTRFSRRTDPKNGYEVLTSQQIVRIHQLLRQAKFHDPSGGCPSPAGEYNLRLGIIKELHPDMVTWLQPILAGCDLNQLEKCELV